MSESKLRNLPRSNASEEHSFQPSREKSPRSKFGTVVQALWPHKPALNLAQRAGISERGAQYLIDGKRKPNARAIHVVTGEMLDGT
jgi:hypothetical protein